MKQILKILEFFCFGSVRQDKGSHGAKLCSISSAFIFIVNEKHLASVISKYLF